MTLALLLAAQEVVPAESLRESWRLLDLPAAWVLVLVIAPLVALVALAAYWKEPIARPWRVLLSGLRAASVVLLLLVLFRPVKVQHQENVQPAEVMLLVDDSASMRRQDAYSGDGELRRALERATGASPDERARVELARAGIERQLLGPLEQRGYRVRALRFSQGTTPIASLDELEGRGHATHVGDAVGQALAAGRGRHVTDLIVVSDGRSNGGLPVLDAASEAGASGIPVHTVVVGDTRPERNLVVELVEAPASVLEGDEVAIAVRVLARGVQAEDSAHVVLEELTPRGEELETRTVASEEARLEEAGERVVLVAPPAESSLTRAERRFRISVPPLPGETMLDDNAVEVSVHVATEKIRVLYVDGYPRWEYRFLKDLLKRADERIVLQAWLMSATPGFPQESTLGVPSLEQVPTERRALLDDYDVVILGDVNPYGISPDPDEGERFVASLFEFVERGGGLCVIAGEYENPRAVAGTDFAKLLPVVIDTSGGIALDLDTRNEFRPALEDPANPHEVVRLEPDAQTNRRLWESGQGLRGFHWFHPVVDAKPGAQVLLRHPTHENNHGRYPLLVTGYYPSGRTMFLAVDSTYRWRYQYKSRYHERFWRNAMRWLALGRLRGGDRRYVLEPLRSTYDLDERVVLEARVLDEDYRPSEEPVTQVSIAGPEGGASPLDLSLVEGRAGLYRGSFECERPGLYRAWIDREGQRVASTEIEVVLPSRENADPSPDPEGLAALASLTGGKAVDLARISDLLSEFPGDEERREPISSKLEDAWDHWGTLLAALALLTAEWVLRKRLELV